MEVSVEKQSKQKLNKLLVVIGILLAAFMYINFNATIEDVADFNIELHTTDVPILVGDSTTLQVLVYDGEDLVVEKAKLSISLSDENNEMDSIKQNLYHVENGLYETEVQFLQSGNWHAKVEVKDGKYRQKETFPLRIEAY